MLEADKLGKMGWWLDKYDNVGVVEDREKRHLDELAAKQPALMTMQAPKVPVQATMDRMVGLMKKDGIEDGVDLRYLEKMVYGDFLRWKAQIIGSCVASGGGRAVHARTLVEVALLGQLEKTHGQKIIGRDNAATWMPYNYGAGRWIGGLRGGDGSFCGAHIQGLQKYGTVRCDTSGLQSDAFPETQSSSLYRRWGDDRNLIRQFEDEGTKYRLTESVRCRSFNAVKEQLCVHLKPLMICSSYGFQPWKKHSTWESNGSSVYIYKRSGSWAHNMTLIGCVLVDGEWYLIVRNSWGPTAHRGRDWFAINQSTADNWLRQSGTVAMTIGELDLPDVERIAI